MATTAAAAVAHAQRHIQHEFFHQDAVRPDRAIAFEPERLVQRRVFERWQRTGIIRAASDGRYWLDVVAYDAFVTRRFNRVRIVLMVLVVLLLVGLVTGILSLSRP